MLSKLRGLSIRLRPANFQSVTASRVAVSSCAPGGTIGAVTAAAWADSWAAASPTGNRHTQPQNPTQNPTLNPNTLNSSYAVF